MNKISARNAKLFTIESPPPSEEKNSMFPFASEKYIVTEEIPMKFESLLKMTIERNNFQLRKEADIHKGRI